MQQIRYFAWGQVPHGQALRAIKLILWPGRVQRMDHGLDRGLNVTALLPGGRHTSAVEYHVSKKKWRQLAESLLSRPRYIEATLESLKTL